jgi:hypothetical protein
VRSRSTCQRIAGSPSSSQSITLTTAGYRVTDGRSGRRTDAYPAGVTKTSPRHWHSTATTSGAPADVAVLVEA